MALSLGRNSANNVAPLHLDTNNHLLVKDDTAITTLGGKLDTIITNTANINVNVGDVEINVQDVEDLITSSNTKLDTINTTLSSGIGGLPASLTGSGNLKVSLQELGNEGSERLNVDVGSTVSQLPSALTGEGNLKVSIQEDFTHNLSTSAKQDTANGHLSNIDTGIDVLEACCGSDKVNVNISSGNISGFSTSAKQDTANGHLNTINSAVGDLATESTLQIIAEEFTKCDTDNVVITGGVVLPSALTGSGNLKVCIQELGNEGSERLNVDIGSAVAQLPTALSGSGRLKIENDFDGAITHTALTELASALNSDKLDVNISSGGFDGAITNTHLNELGTAINSAKVDVNISSGGFDGAITHGALTELASALNSDKLDVNISSGGFDGAITNTHLNELGTAINSAKVDVNISSGNITGFSTSANQSTAIGHLSALAGIVNPAIATATSTTIPNKLDTLNTKIDTLDAQIDLLEGANTIKDVSWLSSVSLSASSLSANLDTEGYKELTLYGKTTSNHASNLHIFGSSGDGTYYHISTLATSSVGGTHYIKEDTPLNLPNPRYFKIYNADTSTATITLRATLTDKRRYV